MSLRLFTRPAAALARAKRIIKLALLNLGLFLLAWPLATQATPAQENFENLQRFGLSVYGQNVPRTPTEIVASLVTILLGFLSTLFVILILIAGFQWMTSGGNEQKVESAKSHLKAATIGLVIILISYSISLSISAWLIKAVGR